jgi:predicted P-loop ATPase
MTSPLDAALGRWPELLQELAGLSPDQLTDRHQPCPACGGNDRYRWDRDDGPGGWFCNQCGGKDHQGGAGSGIDLLMRVRGWQLPDALTAVRQHLGIEQAIPPPPIEGAIAWWQYTPTIGVRRMPDRAGSKVIRPLTWDGSRWQLKAPGKPRPLYWARRNSSLPVLVVEGEKTADAAASLLPTHAVCTWMGGCKAVDLADWQPLARRSVTLWPDADDVGRQAMATLAARLLALGATVAVVTPPQDLPQGWDLADADWTPQQAAEHLQDLARPITPPTAPEPPTAPSPARTEPAAVAFRDKPQRIEAGELLAFLRQWAADGDLRWNLYHQQIEHCGEKMADTERFYLRLADLGYKVGKDLAMDCLLQVAREHLYDPVREYLDHVASTVQPGYIDCLASAYLRLEDSGSREPTLFDRMIRATLIAAVRRAFEPGCKHDVACVLMGQQGGGKSTFWETLAGPFFSDALGDCGDRDDLLVLHRSWIMEWPELDRITSSRHAGQVKAFLSRRSDCFRVPYGKSAEEFPRRGIIVGSTNRECGFLADDTGNRRFWIVPVSATEDNPIAVEALKLERDAIWSAAVAAYRDGEHSHMPAELAAAVNTANEAYQLQHPWEAPILDWLAAPANQAEPITTELVLAKAVQKPTERQSRADLMIVGNILRDAGYERRKARVDGVLRWVFLPRS